jgi:uncharacterized membrane protein YdjX (TVP38/TMEM64 family)
VRAKIFTFHRWWKVLAVVAVIAGAWALAARGVDMHTVHEKAARLNGALAFVLLILLPLSGVPIAILHFAMGVRFGIVLGLALVAVSIPLQLLAFYGLVRWKKEFFRDKFKTLRGRVPPNAREAATVFTLLIPGAPFFAQNYALALMGVPFRTCLRWAFPLHFARATMTVILGDQSDKLTPGRIAWLGLYALLLLGASWWSYRRLQARLTGRRRAGSGRKSPA